jgi:HK97 family phage portal protein
VSIIQRAREYLARAIAPPRWSGGYAPILGLTSVSSVAGLVVNSTRALAYHPVWRAINLLAGDTARVPLELYRVSPRGKVLATDHPAYSLLRWRPNERQNADGWRLAMMGQALLRGNAFSYIERNPAGQPVALWPLDTAACQLRLLRLAPDAQAATGKTDLLVLDYQSQEQGTLRWSYDDILHVHGMGFDGIQGYDLLSVMGGTIGYGMAAQEYGARYFGQSSVPLGVLQTDGTLDEDARQNLGKSWEALRQGLSGAHRIAVLEAGLKYQPIAINARDSQMLETLEHNIVAVANFFGIPSAMLGKQTGSTYATVEGQQQAYLASGLDPWLTRWEYECRAKLLSPQEQRDGSIAVAFDRSRILVMDATTRANYLRTSLAGHPWMTIDEARAMDNLDPIPGETGNTIQVPSNNFASAGTAPASAIGDRAAITGVCLSLLADATTRMRRRLAHQAKACRGKPEKLAHWLAGMDAENRATIVAALAVPAKAMAQLAPLPDQNYTENLASDLMAATRAKLTAASASLETFDAAIQELEK